MTRSTSCIFCADFRRSVRAESCSPACGRSRSTSAARCTTQRPARIGYAMEQACRGILPRDGRRFCERAARRFAPGAAASRRGADCRRFYGGEHPPHARRRERTCASVSILKLACPVIFAVGPVKNVLCGNSFFAGANTIRRRCFYAERQPAGPETGPGRKIERADPADKGKSEPQQNDKKAVRRTERHVRGRYHGKSRHEAS